MAEIRNARAEREMDGSRASGPAHLSRRSSFPHSESGSDSESNCGGGGVSRARTPTPRRLRIGPFLSRNFGPERTLKNIQLDVGKLINQKEEAIYPLTTRSKVRVPPCQPPGRSIT
uniref:Uncharacterized protein n=1 Tax=Oryza glumipatula TaxID=40148 RepID=A0A0E0A7J6_9ORYZ